MTRYDLLRTLSFQVVNKELLSQEFYVLKFPEKWKFELRNLQAEITKREDDKTNVPISLLNKALRALVPDLIYIDPYAGKSGDIPWLYSSQPINAETLYLIVHNWVKIQFSKTNGKRLSSLLNILKPEDLQWQPININTAEWKTEPNGTAALDGSTSFILLPHILTAKLSQKDVEVPFGSEVLRFRRAPLAVGTKGAEIVSWPPIAYNKNQQNWYWSVVVTFTVQTVPFQNFPVLHCDLSVRRWVSGPVTYLPGGKENSVYLLTEVPWLEGLQQSNSFQVAPIKWQKIATTEQQEGESSYRLIWGSDLAPLLDKLNLQNKFPTPEEIKKNPFSALNLNGSPTAALVYRHGIEPDHEVGSGFSPQDRRCLAEQIANLLTPDCKLVSMPERVKLKSSVPTNPFFPSSNAKKKTSLNEFQIQRCRAIREAVGNYLTIEIWYQEEKTKKALIEGICECLGIPESASFPYKFPDVDLTIAIDSQLLGELGSKLSLNSEIKNEKDRRRDAIKKRTDDIKEKMSKASGVKAALIELDNADKFDGDDDPKNAIRRGFACFDRITQFITPDQKNLPHRAKSAFMDLLRQLGVQAAPPKIGIKKTNLPEKLNYVGIWLIKQNSPTSADGSIQRVPVLVYIASDTSEIKAIAPGFKDWLPYREALLKIAKGEAKGFQKPEEAMMRFIKPKLEEVLSLGDTLLLCHAQNLRSAWSWLANKHITLDKIAFGKEKPEVITHFKGLRIVRVRDSQSHETPEWYAQKGDEKGWCEGIFAMGQRVFASTYNKPKQFQVPKDLSRVSYSKTTKGKPLPPSPDTYFKNPGLVEVTVACIQPGDDIQPWAFLAHELRHLALNYDEALKLPLPLHLAKQMEEYVLLIDNEEG